MFEITAWFRIDIDWEDVRVYRNSVPRAPVIEWAIRFLQLAKRLVIQALTMAKVVIRAVPYRPLTIRFSGSFNTPR